MKIKLLMLLLFLGKFTFGQDTLNCKRDLTWDEKAKFYYRKNDADKKAYTGPANCIPRKGLITVGYLKDGKWDGIAKGYKGKLYLGFVEYSNGLYHGKEVRYNEQGFIKDSSTYEHGKKVFEKWNFYKNGQLYRIVESDYRTDTIHRSYKYYQNGLLESIVEEHWFQKKRCGHWVEYYAEEGVDGQIEQKLDASKYYAVGGKLQKEDFFDGGYLYQQKIYDENGKVKMELLLDGSIDKLVQSTPFQNGKKHGEVKYYEVGKLYQIDIYEKGKLIETKEINN